MPEFRMIDGAVPIRAAVEGAGPLVLMVHGFPESWFSWRHQIGPVANAGFTAVAIDVRGYGGSGKPHPVEAYAMEHIVGDLVRVADALAPGEPAVLVGHDWGAPIVWNSAMTRPDRFRAVAALSVPHLGVPSRPLTEWFTEHFTNKNKFFYQAYFQKEGVAEAELEADVRDFLLRMMYSISGDAPPGTWPDKPADAKLLDGMPLPPHTLPWLTDEDLDYFAGEFERSGLRGPINRYRNHERDWTWFQQFKGWTIDQPALFIGGTRDPASTLFGALKDPVVAMRPHVPNVEGHMLEGCGHWTQQERPEAVTHLLLDWLGRLPAR